MQRNARVTIIKILGRNSHTESENPAQHNSAFVASQKSDTVNVNTFPASRDFDCFHANDGVINYVL